MYRPLIGLIPGFAPPDRSRSFSQAHSINAAELNYQKCIEQVGGLPCLIPYVSDTDSIAQYCAQLDGLMLLGGDDVDPKKYHQIMMETPYPPVQERDEFEERFVRRFFETGKPVFGICRGIQMLNVIFCGSLIQDMPTQLNIVHHVQESGSTGITHTVSLEPDSLTARLIGPERIEVNSFHHQCIDRLGAGLIATGFSEEGIVEIVEHEDHPFCLAVQWHPERMQQDERQMRLFRTFAEAARGDKKL